MSWFPFTVATGAMFAADSRAKTCARSLRFANWTLSPSRRIRSTPALGEPLERRVGAPVEMLGLEDVDPA